MNSGQNMLAMSFSEFDPTATFWLPIAGKKPAKEMAAKKPTARPTEEIRLGAR
jgi:hypothetical protein